MKKRFFNFNIIFGCFCVFFAFYIPFTTEFYNRTSGFNYRAFFFFLVILVLGIAQLFKKNEPIGRKRIWLLFGTILVAAFAILIFTVVNQKKQIKKMEKIEQSKSGIK